MGYWSTPFHVEDKHIITSAEVTDSKAVSNIDIDVQGNRRVKLLHVSGGESLQIIGRKVRIGFRVVKRAGKGGTDVGSYSPLNEGICLGGHIDIHWSGEIKSKGIMSTFCEVRGVMTAGDNFFHRATWQEWVEE